MFIKLAFLGKTTIKLIPLSSLDAQGACISDERDMKSSHKAEINENLVEIYTHTDPIRTQSESG